MRLLLLALFVIGQPNFAQTGSDVLLNQLGEKPPEAPVQEQKKSGAPRAEVSKPVPVVKVRPKPPSDSFQAQLELKAYRQENLPFDVNQWVQDVVYADFAKAAHQWTAIQTQVPEGFRIEAQATQLYLLWKLGLNQTFFNEWIRALANAEFAKSAPAAALEILVTPGFDAWLIKSPVVVSPKQVTTLEKLADDKPLLLTLKAWAALRQGQGRKETALLKKLAPASPLAPLLSEREVYASVKVGDLKGAAWALKNFMEPAVQASKDPELLVKQNVTIARILYQAGQIQAAQGFYERIPNQSNSYLAAREELAWVYLREGDMPKLRGQIKTLASPIFKDRFQPETYLLRAVSDLKMCFYDEVDKDLKDFSRSNTQWAKRIDEALARDVVPQPANPDDYAKLSGRTVALLTSETMKLQALGDQSIGAALPAVGWQKHWKDYLSQAQGALEEAKKRQGDEYTRQWKNERNVLVEAIRKMRFVKVEYMSQVRQLSVTTGGSASAVGAAVTAQNALPPLAAKVVANEPGQLTFPVDNEVWSDEMFKMRSAAQAQCLKKSVVR